MKWLILALSVLALCAGAAMFGDARGEPILLEMVLDCTEADQAKAAMESDGLTLGESYADRYGQHRERWVRADGAWVDVALGHVGPMQVRCVVAAGKPPGEPL